MRNTNTNDILFPVSEEKVCLEGQTKPLPGYKAIVGEFDKVSKTFAIVSNNYQLVKNADALELGQKIHRKLFPDANANSFEVFNIIIPKTRSFCHIDIIDKNYTLNIWKQESYVPFVRIHNSYNRSRSLKFDIGFCRKLCDNGVIFEQNTIELKFAHTRQAINFDEILKIEVGHLKKLEQDFIAKTQECNAIKLPRKYFIPLAAKVLERNFKVEGNDIKKKVAIKAKMEIFSNFIKEYSKKYIDENAFGETAYTFFNVITDYISNSNDLQAGAINGLQTKCGMWINKIGQLVTKPAFNWDDEIKDYTDLLN